MQFSITQTDDILVKYKREDYEMDLVGRFRLVLWRCVVLAFLLVLPAGARAAGSVLLSGEIKLKMEF